MRKTMRKIIIAYDGSPCAKAAINDLKNAGLPDEVEATIVSVADVWLPPDDQTTLDLLPDEPPAAVVAARNRAKEAIDQSLMRAVEGAQFVRQLFPQWIVRTQNCSDSPAWALVKKAEDWEAEMIVVGAHGRSTLERIMLGSVSQTVAANAKCSVRIGRTSSKAAETPLRLLIGYDGSANAEALIKEVAARHWVAGTQVRVLVVIDDVLATVHPWRIPGYITWTVGEPGESYENSEEWVKKMAGDAAQRLQENGLAAAAVVRHGNPKELLVEEANEWDADCIFVGARGLGRFERFLLGSVSNAVSSRAHCTVEVVRSA
jgi:nucleotide-binding universal stress UspA family protein